MRLSCTVLSDLSVMPFPWLPEMTLETAPDRWAGFSPIVFPNDDRDTKIPSPWFPATAPERLRPM